MRNTWIAIFFFSVCTMYSAFSREKHFLKPSIAVLRVEDDSLVMKLTNNTSRLVRVAMTRHGMGTIGCRTLSVKSKSGVSLTENNILPGGYWTPDVLESDGDFVEELNKLLVGIPPGSSVIFSVPIMPYLRNEPWDVTQVGSVSPRISYVKADGTDGEATGPLFRMIEPRAKQ